MGSCICIGILGWEWMSLFVIVVHCPFVFIIGCSSVVWVYQVSPGQSSGHSIVSSQMCWGICDSHLAAGSGSRGCPSSSDVKVVIVLMDGLDPKRWS